jgi:GR25 family glycosyltransferase involved in LPS biosynthesis
MKNIDFIYTINLDQRPEKFAHCLNELAPYGICPYRFSAVNGWELSLEVINMLGIQYQDGMVKNLWGTAYLPDGNFESHHEVMDVKERTYFCHCMSRGAIGIVLSHLSVLQDAYDSGYETIWVMEDDIKVIQNPYVLSQLIDKLNSLTGERGWDILFTDQDTKNREGEYVPCFSHATRPNYAPENPEKFASRVNFNNIFRKIGARYGAYSMIVSRSGMQKILKFFKTYRIFLPYDMDFYLPDAMAIYTVISDVISTEPQALSDNGNPNYMKN